MFCKHHAEIKDKTEQMADTLLPIQALWFKRDLRLSDHEPLKRASELPHSILLFYCFEPKLVASAGYDLRHWRFVWQSLQEMNDRLSVFNHHLHVLWADPQSVLEWLSSRYSLAGLLSHEETGLKITFDRDRRVAEWCKQKGVFWRESRSNGIIRGLANRQQWRCLWADFINKSVCDVDLSQLKTIRDPELEAKFPLPLSFVGRLIIKASGFQPGGSSKGLAYLNSFLQERCIGYRRYMSKPAESRRSCSRISPYLAWGCLSIRQIYQRARSYFEEVPHTAHLAEAYLSRLRWQGHFIQKFESECQIEFQNFNRGFDVLRTEWNDTHYLAWSEGRTGYPLVDACMRCLEATGWINFRMRAMLVSFLTHHLWLDWQAGARHLSQLFLDFEPGIHYPQFHMQAGTTGVHTFRIYNPERQAALHDPKAIFIKKWLPELEPLPVPLALAPYRMTHLEEVCYGVRLGVDYPKPVVDIRLTYRIAQERLWRNQQTNELVQAEAQRILQRHTTLDRKV